MRSNREKPNIAIAIIIWVHHYYFRLLYSYNKEKFNYLPDVEAFSPANDINTLHFLYFISFHHIYVYHHIILFIRILNTKLWDLVLKLSFPFYATKIINPFLYSRIYAKHNKVVGFLL